MRLLGQQPERAAVLGGASTHVAQPALVPVGRQADAVVGHPQDQPVVGRLHLDDRRGTLVKLTRKGRSAIDKLIAVHLANEERLLQSLKSAERLALDAALRRLLATLEPDGDA